MKARLSPQRIGRWSAAHPWRALIVWLVFVAACVALGARTGTQSLSDGAVGESAQGNAVMDQPGLWGPPREYAYLHSNVLLSSDPGFEAAVRDTKRRLAALGLPVTRTTSADRHSVLLSAVPGQPANPAQVRGLITALAGVPAALSAVARAHPGLTIAETGDTSASHAQDRIVNGDLHRVELLAIPVTLVVLLLAFGSDDVLLLCQNDASEETRADAGRRWSWGAHSAAIAVSTSSRAARRAGPMLASTPAAPVARM